MSSLVSDRPQKKQKMEYKKRGLMPAFDENTTEVYLGKHWSGSDMPLLQTTMTAGKYANATLSTPIVPVKFSNLGPNGSIGTCNGLIQRENATFDVSIHKTIAPDMQDKLPGAQQRINEFYAFMKKTTSDMLSMAWESDGLFQGHKDKAKKEAKKYVKKNGGDVEEEAKRIFIENAKLSMFKTYEDDDGNEFELLVFKRKYETKNGLNRPKIFRPVRVNGKTHLKDITEEVSWVSSDSLVKFEFQLNMYDLPQMYGIKAALGMNVMAVKLEKHKKASTNDDKPEEVDAPVFDDW